MITNELDLDIIAEDILDVFLTNVNHGKVQLDGENNRINQIKTLNKVMVVLFSKNDPSWIHYQSAINKLRETTKKENIKSIQLSQMNSSNKVYSYYNQIETKKLYFDWVTSYLFPSLKKKGDFNFQFYVNELIRNEIMLLIERCNEIQIENDNYFKLNQEKIRNYNKQIVAIKANKNLSSYKTTLIKYNELKQTLIKKIFDLNLINKTFKLKITNCLNSLKTLNEQLKNFGYPTISIVKYKEFTYEQMFANNKYLFTCDNVPRYDGKFMMKINGINYHETIFNEGIVSSIINYQLNLFHLNYFDNKYPVCENFIILKDIRIDENYLKSKLMSSFFRLHITYVKLDTTKKKYGGLHYSPNIKLETNEDVIIQIIENLEKSFKDHLSTPPDNINESVGFIANRKMKYKLTKGSGLEENFYEYIQKFKKTYFQLIYALYCGQEWFGFKHNDLHDRNIMYNEIDEDFLIYRIPLKDGKYLYYEIPTKYLLKLFDFDYSHINKRDILNTKLNDEIIDYFKYDILKKSLKGDDYNVLSSAKFNKLPTSTPDIIFLLFKILNFSKSLHAILVLDIEHDRIKKLREEYKKTNRNKGISFDDMVNQIKEFVFQGILGLEKTDKNNILISFIKLLFSPDPEVINDVDKKNFRNLSYIKDYKRPSKSLATPGPKFEYVTREKVDLANVYYSIHEDFNDYQNPYFTDIISMDFIDLLQMPIFDEFKQDEKGFKNHLNNPVGKRIYVYIDKPKVFNEKDFKDKFKNL